jgi:protoporphyrinogen oxidase
MPTNEQPGCTKAVIIGAGPAGLTAAYTLSKEGIPAVILEADRIVGGIARTVNYKGFLFDIGGHRFFTKWDEVKQIWDEILKQRFLTRPRLSRIYYRGKFFFYPLRPKNAFLGLGPIESVRIFISYFKSRLFPNRSEENLEDWVSNRFGRRLYEIFFKTYTEKVWGVPCTTIRAEWAAQRIRGLSLTAAVRNAFLKSDNGVKTLIDKFQYPERGPGQMWETLSCKLENQGYPVLLERPVVRICHAEKQVSSVVTKGPSGDERHYGTHFISSMPIRELIQGLEPPAPPEVREAANQLRYRDFLIVSLIVNRKEVMPDNWLYIHEPQVRVGRIQNFKNWSPAMVPNPNQTCLGMEYFVFENDDLWSSSDAALITLAKGELVKLGLAREDEIVDGSVVRMPKAYPMYDEGWSERVQQIRSYLEQNLSNLQLVGRNGMHKYNNQDHSMMTAICAAKNICGASYDLWAINSEPEYHEEKKLSEPQTVYQRPAYANPPVLGQSAPVAHRRVSPATVAAGEAHAD